MRPKIAMFVIGSGLAVLLGLSLLRSSRHGDASATVPSSAVNQSATVLPPSAPPGKAQVAAEPVTTSAHAAPTSPAPATISPSSPSASAPEEYVEQRVGELMDLAMTDDPRALQTILAELGNTNGAIRQASIEAAKQFGSTNAIPSLEEAISKTDSAEDRQDLREAIEFLKLPSFVARRN